MFCHCITGSGNSNVSFKKFVSSLIVISLLFCLCFSAGATPAEGDIDLYKGVIAGYAIVSGIQFYSWREVYHFAEDFYQKIITQQTPEQLNFMDKISYTDFEEFDFYFLKFNSRPDVLTAFVSAVESTYDVNLNPNSASFSSSINVDKLLAMPGVFDIIDTSIGSNSATDYGIVYTLGSKVPLSEGNNLISTNNRGSSLFVYSLNGFYHPMFKLGPYFLSVSNKLNLSSYNIYSCCPAVRFRIGSKTSSTFLFSKGVYISSFDTFKAFNSCSSNPIAYNPYTAEEFEPYSSIQYGLAWFDSQGYLYGFSSLQPSFSSTGHLFWYHTDPLEVFNYSSLGVTIDTQFGSSSFGSFEQYLSSPAGNSIYHVYNARSTYLYNSDYTFSPSNIHFSLETKIPSTESTSTPINQAESASLLATDLFSSALGMLRYNIGVQIQSAGSYTVDKAYLLDSDSLYNQLLTEEKVIRVPYNLLELDTDTPNEEIPPTPPSIEDSDTPIGDISDSSQQVGDNLNGTSGSIDELGGGLLVPDVDLDGTLGNIPNDGVNSVSTFISLVITPLMNYPIVTTLLLCLLGFTAVKLILYGTGRD